MTSGRREEVSSSVVERFHQACDEESRGPHADPELLPVRLARACATALPVDGAGISLLDRDFRVPLGASSSLAGFAERLQFTVGEGPCLDAAASRRSLVADSVQIDHRWPIFAGELRKHTPYCAIVALPLQLSATLVGAVDLYLTDPRAVADLSLGDAFAVGDAVASALLNATEGDPAQEPDHRESGEAEFQDEPAWVRTPDAQLRQLVWVAIGMVMTRRNIDADDALALLRAYSYSHGLTVDGTARGLVGGDISLAQVAAD